MHRVQVLNRQKLVKMNPKAASSFCREALRALDRPDCLLSVVFLRNSEIRSLNRRYRGRDYPADVLSFGYGNEMLESKQFLGEIIISPETAREQARRWHTPLEKEIRRLLLHGILHLLGYDHESDKGEMNQVQRRLMRRGFFGDASFAIVSEVRG